LHEVCVNDVDVVLDDDVVVVKMSLLLKGSSADWDDKLNTEPQSISDRVLLLSTSSTSPNAESASLELLLGELEDANWEMPGDVFDGKGVARPDDGSLSG
jgi:hypothetical protein